MNMKKPKIYANKKHGNRHFRPDKKSRLERYNGWIGGVCQGIGNYLNIDPNIFRFLFLLAFCVKGWGILPYIILWIIIPENEKL